VNLLSFVFILTSLVTFVAGQLFLKRAMESTPATGDRHPRFASLLGAGIFLMTISFFLTLGLLQRFDLSYLYPFQGLSVVIISFAAAIVLRERLTLQLTIGAALISAGIILVSIS
jgi:undecaprenyl phosphate-alpha-L-ara4N flippase subunit ArnE